MSDIRDWSELKLRSELTRAKGNLSQIRKAVRTNARPAYAEFIPAHQTAIRMMKAEMKRRGLKP